MISNKSSFYQLSIVVIFLNYYIYSAFSFVFFGIDLSGTDYMGRAIIFIFSIYIIITFFHTPKSSPILILIYFFWLIWLSRLLLDSFFNPESLRMPFELYMAYFIGIQLIPSLAAYFLVFNYGFNTSYYFYISLITLVLLINSISQVLTSGGLLDSDSYSRGLSTDWANTTGLSYLSLSIAAASASILLNKKKNEIISLVHLSIVLISIIPILAFSSRIVMVLYFLLLLFLFFLKYKKSLFLIFLVILPVSFIQFQNYIYLFENFAFWKKLLQLTNDSSRENMIRNSLDEIKASPIYGSGIEPLGWYPHNLILEAFMIFGIFSGVIFLIIYFYGLHISYKIMIQKNNFFVGFMIFSLLIGSLVSGNLYNNQWFWMILLIGAAITQREAIK